MAETMSQCLGGSLIRRSGSHIVTRGGFGHVWRHERVENSHSKMTDLGLGIISQNNSHLKKKRGGK